MKISNLNPEPIAQFEYLNAGRSPNSWSVDQLPVFCAEFASLPASLDAIVVTADLQGRETMATSLGRPPALTGEILPQQLHVLLKKMGLLSDRVGAILAGDFYTYQDLRGRGGTGDVTDVWQSFANQFKWVIGVAGNHDMFGDQKSKRPNFNSRRNSNAHFLDGERCELDGIRFSGISGVVGSASKNFRRSLNDFVESVELITSEPTDIAIMHEGPNACESDSIPFANSSYKQFRGIPEIREVLTRTQPSIVIRGHCHWPQPLIEMKCGVQVLNVDATVVLLTRAAKN